MSKKDLIIIACKSMCEGQSIVAFVRIPNPTNLIFKLVLVIFNIVANSMPAQVFGLALVHAVRKYTHTKVVQTVRLRQVNYIKPNFVPFSCVTYPKKIPLSMTICIDIVL